MTRLDRVTGVLIPCLLTIIILSCDDKKADKNPAETSDQQALAIGQIKNLWRTDTLTLFAEFEECGEWGGHIETFKIYSKSDTPMTSNEDLWFDYKRDSVDCSADPNENRRWILKFNDKLTNDNQKKVIEYIHDLLDNSLSNERLPRHSGQYYSVFNRDSSIVISSYGPQIDGFLKLKTQLVK